MQIRCPACDQTLSIEGTAPKFCSECGQPLSSIQEISDEQSATIKIPTGSSDEAATLAPSGQKTQGLDSKTRPIAAGDDWISPDTTIGPFRIIRKLGQGGMGSVYEAQHETTGQLVALKLLSRDLLATDDSVERFQRESQIAASINHPRSTFVYEAGQLDDQFYITMELMTGGTLKEVVDEEGPLPVEKAVDYVLDIIDGLQVAHEAGIVHRDLKPSNCFVDHGGRVKIGDFGLAKSFFADSSLTRTGTFMGTPQYAAPEQLRASDVDLQADIYALGGTLFFLLTGRAPFVGNAAQVISSIATDPAPDINSVKPGIPKALARLIQQSLEKDPKKRQENLVAFRTALLPFSARGASQADLGRRMAAFFLDTIMAAIVVVAVSQFVAVAAILVGGIVAGTNMKLISLLSIFVQYATLICFFAIPESRFGRTFGKWLMGMRVVDEKNESPSFLNAVIRVALVPGLSQLCVTIPSYFIMSGLQTQSPTAAIKIVMQLQAFQLASWIPTLICMSTARLSNGYRGIHDLLSGTRVVRLAGALESKRPGNVPVTIPIAIDDNEKSALPSIDSYDVIGRFSPQNEAGPADVLLAKDEALDRHLWLVPAVESEAVDPDQSNHGTTKIRTLAQRRFDGQNWFVTEAIKGIPLLKFLDDSPAQSWSSLLPVLQEVLEELESSLDGTRADAPIDCDQFWIGQAGRIKFLDISKLPANVNEQYLDEPATDGIQQRVAIVETLLDSIIENHTVPEHVLAFRQSIKNDPDDPERLKRIAQQLNAMEDRPSSWRWDDRLGVAAATYGVEYSTLFSLTLMGSMIWSSFFKTNSTEPVNATVAAPLGITAFLAGSLLILAAGFLFRGGPIFRFTGVSVRKNRTQVPASGIRCAIRNWISWLPVLAFLSSLAMLIYLGVRIDQEAAQSLDTELSLPIFVLICSLCLSFLFMLAGMAYSIIRPPRGLADLICGTRLIRK